MLGWPIVDNDAVCLCKTEDVLEEILGFKVVVLILEMDGPLEDTE